MLIGNVLSVAVPPQGGLSAAMSLGFLGGNTLDPRITFTRATSATRFNSQGVLETLGYNLASYSEDGTQWGAGAVATVTGNALASPIGTVTATKFVSTNADASFGRLITPIAATQYTGSIWLRTDGTPRNINIYLNGGGILPSQAVFVTNTWTRFSITGTTTSTAGMALQIGGGGTFSTGQDLYAWGLQIETGPVATGYSATTATGANSAPRFDYDPATPAGTTGVELLVPPTSLASWSVIQPSAGAVSVTNGVTRVNTTDGTIAQFQDTSVSMPGGQVLGKTYLLTATFSMITGNAQVLDGANVVQSTITTSGTYAVYVRAYNTASPLFIIKRQSGVTDFSVSNISIKEVTFTPRGLLIEEARTNVLKDSRDGSTANWSRPGATVVRNALGIDGVANTAFTITSDTSTGNHYCQQTTAANANNPVTFSAYVKAGTQGFIELRLNTAAGGIAQIFQLSNGTLGTLNIYGTGYAALGASSYKPVGNGWYRLSITATTTDTGSIAGSLFMASGLASDNFTGTGADTVLVDAVQLEAGAFPTSYIPTTTASVTRNADNAAMVSPNFGWWNQPAGSMVVEGDTYRPTPGGFLAQASIGSGSDQVGMSIDGSQRALILIQVAAVDQSTTPTSNTVATNSVFKIGISYQVNGTSTVLNGGTVAVDPTNSLPTPTKLQIGSDNNVSSWIDGHIRRIVYYNTRLTDAQLQDLTR